jgi:hypothetical protein
MSDYAITGRCKDSRFGGGCGASPRKGKLTQRHRSRCSCALGHGCKVKGAMFAFLVARARFRFEAGEQGAEYGDPK